MKKGTFNVRQIFRLYVGNLDDRVTWKELKDHFKQSGGYVVRANIKTDMLGKSMGWGLVEYSRSEDAVEAIAKLDNTDLMGKTINVRDDRNQQAERSLIDCTSSFYLLYNHNYYYYCYYL